VIDDILRGNEGARLPGSNAAKWRDRTRAAGGLLFSEPEVKALNELAVEACVPALEGPFKRY
jgi:hypothetical protein